ncbi:hypothetical protein NW844_11460, partial [Synechococcus sp. H55.2]
MTAPEHLPEYRASSYSILPQGYGAIFGQIAQHGLVSSGSSTWPAQSLPQTQRTEIEILPVLPVL